MSTQVLDKPTETTKPDAGKWTCQQVHSLMCEDGDCVALVDVRSALEYHGERIEGANNIPLDQLEDRVKEIGTANGTVVLICASGARAEMAAQTLQRRGLTDFAILDGGMKAWVKAKLPHKTGKRVLPVMRQVQIAAGLLVLLGVVLGTFVNPWLYGISAFVGAGLTFAGASGFCGMAKILMIMPWNKVPAAEMPCASDKGCAG